MGEVLLIALVIIQSILVVSTIVFTRRLQLSLATLQRVETLFKLEERIAAKLKKLENPSIELQEFLADIAESGCSVLTIRPDSIFIRGLRR